MPICLRQTGGSISTKKGIPSGIPFFVEMGGLEPPSKQRTRQLSTRLSFHWLSADACRKAGQQGLILWVLSDFKGVRRSVPFE